MKVECVLMYCKFSRRYQGYHELKECISIALEDEERLLYVGGIYCEVALKHRISASGVERNIRTVLNHAWRNGGRKSLEALSGGIFYEKPSASELIEVLVCSIKEQTPKKEYY